jgi:DNA gyrase subunit B
MLLLLWENVVMVDGYRIPLASSLIGGAPGKLGSRYSGVAASIPDSARVNTPPGCKSRRLSKISSTGWSRRSAMSLSSSTKSSSVDGDSYDSQSITVLQGLEPVRLRPGMYIGSTGSRGLHHLVYEVVDNAVDEALTGYCNEINITLSSCDHYNNSNEEDIEAAECVSVEDNGRGIPCDIHPHTNKSTLETVLCVLHAGGKFGASQKHGYSVSGGLHGVGVSVVNALSQSLTATVYRDGINHTMAFSRGVPTSPMRSQPLDSAIINKRGTIISFQPDPQIFKSPQDRVYDYKTLAKRFDELAYLNPGLTFNVVDTRASKDASKNGAVTTQTYRHEGGISELLAEVLCKNKKSLHPKVPIITLHYNSKQQAHGKRSKASTSTTTVGGVTVEVALQWSEDSFGSENVVSFANNINTIDGGSHVDGLRAAVGKVVNQFAKKV